MRDDKGLFVEATYCTGCGIIIKDSSIKYDGRALCKYCYKTYCSDRWLLVKDERNEKRRAVRKKKQYNYRCLCCGKEFISARKNRLTCGDSNCQKSLKRAQERIKRKEKHDKENN